MPRHTQGSPSNNPKSIPARFGICWPGDHSRAWALLLRCASCQQSHCRSHPCQCTTAGCDKIGV